MNTLRLSEEAADGNADYSGTVTRGMMRKRAIELAMSDGRSALEASKSDWEQANRNLADRTGIKSKVDINLPRMSVG